METPQKKSILGGKIMRHTHHVVPSSDGWKVIKGGSERASGCYKTKQSAIDAGRIMSRNQKTELVIHNKNGRISGSDSHGNDPCPPVDRT